MEYLGDEMGCIAHGAVEVCPCYWNGISRWSVFWLFERLVP